MNLAEYRAAVVDTVGCPFCGARRSEACTNTYGSANPVRKPAGYVHDDRSLVFHTAGFERVAALCDEWMAEPRGTLAHVAGVRLDAALSGAK